MYLGAPAAAPRSMKSKSSTRFSAARPTTNRLNAIPIGPRVDERDALAEEPMTIETRYRRPMAPVAATMPSLKFSLGRMRPSSRRPAARPGCRR
jgi:hypothetical protein